MAEAVTSLRVRWAELLPDELRERRSACSLAWLPMGLCEPHGRIAAFGLDTLKADWLCDEGARRFGGVVAPTQGWHIHETGYHARWLEEVVGEESAELGGLPPEVVLKSFLFQLRALTNAGFRSVLVLTGHAGGNEADLSRLAQAYTAHIPVKVAVRADPELVAGEFTGDHAGKFEISQLLAIRPDLVDFGRLLRSTENGPKGRFALGYDAHDASPELGRRILEAQLRALGKLVNECLESAPTADLPRVSLAAAEQIWRDFERQPEPLRTAQPSPDQRPVSEKSQWKEGEQWQPLPPGGGGGAA